MMVLKVLSVSILLGAAAQGQPNEPPANIDSVLKKLEEYPEHPFAAAAWFAGKVSQWRPRGAYQQPDQRTLESRKMSLLSSLEALAARAIDSEDKELAAVILDLTERLPFPDYPYGNRQDVELAIRLLRDNQRLRRPEAAKRWREQAKDLLGGVSYNTRWKMAKLYLLCGELQQALEVLREHRSMSTWVSVGLEFADDVRAVLSLLAEGGYETAYKEVVAGHFDSLIAALERRAAGTGGGGFRKHINPYCVAEYCRAAGALDASFIRKDEALKQKARRLWTLAHEVWEKEEQKFPVNEESEAVKRSRAALAGLEQFEDDPSAAAAWLAGQTMLMFLGNPNPVFKRRTFSRPDYAVRVLCELPEECLGRSEERTVLELAALARGLLDVWHENDTEGKYQRSIARNLIRLGRCYWVFGRRPEANDLVRRALAIYEDSGIYGWHAWEVAGGLLRSGEQEKASDLLEKHVFDEESPPSRLPYRKEAKEALDFALETGAEDFYRKTQANLLTRTVGYVEYVSSRHGYLLVHHPRRAAIELCRGLSLVDPAIVREDERMRQKAADLWDRVRSAWEQVHSR